MTPQLFENARRYPAVDQVLLHGGAHPSTGKVPGDAAQDGELLGGDVPEGQLDGDDVVAVLLLGANIAGEPPFEGRVPLPVALGGDGGGGFVDELGWKLHEGLGVVRLLGPGLLQLLFDLGPKGVDAHSVDVELDAGFHPVAAQLVGAVEDANDGLADPEVVLDGDEVVEGVGEPGHDGSAASGDHFEAASLHAVFVNPSPWLEGEIVNGGYHAIVIAAGEGHLELSGEGLGLGVADEPAGEGGEVGADVEGLVGGDAGERTADDVSDGVAAGLPGGEARFAQNAHHVGGVFQLDEVELDVLPGGDVALVEGNVLFDDFAHGLELIGGEAAGGHLDAYHVDVGLALAVYAADEPVGGELEGVFPPALLEAGDLGLEVGDFLGQVGNYALRIVKPGLVLYGRASFDGSHVALMSPVSLCKKSAPSIGLDRRGATLYEAGLAPAL